MTRVFLCSRHMRLFALLYMLLPCNVMLVFMNCDPEINFFLALLWFAGALDDKLLGEKENDRPKIV
jgi:hypothetical protein